jgi:outer membrane protein TolC
VFDTGQARRELARALTAEQRHRLTEARRGVVEDVRSSLESLGSAQRNLARVESELIPMQERRRSETEEAYRLGLVDVTALLFADQALQESQARRVDLAREVAAARTRLERSVGGPAALELAGVAQP